MPALSRALAIAGAAFFAAEITACGSDTAVAPVTPHNPVSCPGIDVGARPAQLTISSPAVKTMAVFGAGVDTARYTAEVTARGTVAYTTTWGFRGANPGNKIDVWDVSGNVPALVDSVIVSNATTLGDVAVSDDGALLVVATERTGGAIVIFDLSDPKHPKQISRFSNSDTDPGVHTAEIGRVNGVLYGFLAIDPINSTPARLVIVDLSNPAAPREVYTKVTGNPYVHDTFVRDGLLFVALWDDGLEIWDIGGCGTGASPSNPVVLGGVKTLGGEAHNVWWYHDANGGKRFAFVGQEGPGNVGSSSTGDIHVIDMSEPSQPIEVAFYHEDGAGTHNFSVDEANGILYAAYYNGGVRALDIRGDLAACPASQTLTTVNPLLTRCDLKLMGREMATGLLNQNRSVYVWGVDLENGSLYASDMLNGIWKLGAVSR
jgi:hypothetical protein